MINSKILLNLSVNPHIRNKNEGGNKKYFSRGWENSELSPEELGKLISLGAAFSYQYDGVRSSRNFYQTNVIAVDFDGTREISDVLEDPLVKHNFTILYTTQSHTPDEPHFRVVFALPRLIVDKNEVVFLSRAITSRLSGDMSATDAARIFYGSSGCDPIIQDQQLDELLMEQLIEDGKNIAVSDSVGNVDYQNNNVSTIRSSLLISSDTLIRVDGSSSSMRLADVKHQYRIFCPFHNDKNASAFVNHIPNKGTYIHCKSSYCAKTWWMVGSTLSYNFNSFDQAVRDPQDLIAKGMGLQKVDFEIPSHFDDVLSQSRVNFYNDQYFKLNGIRKGINLIKSPKGSGKTSSLREILDQYSEKDGNLDILSFIEENTDPSSTPLPRESTNKFRILLIGHRQALIRDLCNRIGLACYLDDVGLSDLAIEKRQKRYGICLDSLGKIQKNKYDLIIIDEVEQVLSHFLSSTLDSSRERIFEGFKHLLKNADYMVALDADLGWATFNTLTDLAGAKNVMDSESKPVWIHINEYKENQGELQVFNSEPHLMSVMKRDIQEGRRLFITSNSKNKILDIDQAIKEQFPDIAEKIITITSENSRTESIQKFIGNIKSESLKYQLILSSPSVGTGVDITFEGKRKEFDAVYGFFVNQVNTHFDIDQQLSRVRHPKEIKVWISPQTFNFETDSKIISNDLLISNLLANNVVGFDSVTHETEYIKASPLVNMASLVLSKNRASKNHLKKNFIKYKSDHGWHIKVILKEDLEIQEGRNFLKKGAELRRKIYLQSIANAKPIDQGQWIEISDKFDSNDEMISREEMWSFKRSNIEFFYQESISENLLLLDDEGTYRSCVRRFEFVTNSKEVQKTRDIFNISIGNKNKLKTFVIEDSSTSKLVLHDWLSQTPFFDNGKFDLSCVYKKEDLKKFVKYAQKNKDLIETQLNISIRSDIEKKPTQQLGDLLQLLGLKNINVSTEKKGHDKFYSYSLDPKTYQVMCDVVKKRKNGSKNPWEFIHHLYGFTTSLYERADHPVYSNNGNFMYEISWWKPLDPKNAQIHKRTKKLHEKHGILDTPNTLTQ